MNRRRFKNERKAADWGEWYECNATYNPTTGVTEEVGNDIIIVRNNIYTVEIAKANVDFGEVKEMIYLSIKRNDKKAFHDWRVFQRIKNELAGPEHEAVELYPAESRKVDTANQYHLFVLPDSSMRFPFGFNDGVVVDYTGEFGDIKGAKQRGEDEPLEDLKTK